MVNRYKILSLALAFVVSAAFSVQTVFAQSLLIRLEEPESPNTVSPLKINYVVLDMENRVVTVKCFKQGPSDAGYTQFGPDQSTIPGGNTGFCQADGSVLNESGTFKFYATAEAGAENSVSPVVQVDSDVVRPGKPTSFKVDYKDSCEDEVSMKTANDGGETTKVNIYRSTSKDFDANSGTLTRTVSVGSNTVVDETIGRSDCGDKYYYAAMALDDAGNHSDIVVQTLSETEIITVTVTETKTSVFGGIVEAIATGGGNLPSPAGETGTAEVAGAAEEQPGGTPAEEGQVEGAATTGPAEGETFFDRIPRNGWLVIILALLAGGVTWFFRRKKKSTQI